MSSSLRFSPRPSSLYSSSLSDMSYLSGGPSSSSLARRFVGALRGMFAVKGHDRVTPHTSEASTRIRQRLLSERLRLSASTATGVDEKRDESPSRRITAEEEPDVPLIELVLTVETAEEATAESPPPPDPDPEPDAFSVFSSQYLRPELELLNAESLPSLYDSEAATSQSEAESEFLRNVEERQSKSLKKKKGSGGKKKSLLTLKKSASDSQCLESAFEASPSSSLDSPLGLRLRAFQHDLQTLTVPMAVCVSPPRRRRRVSLRLPLDSSPPTSPTERDFSEDLMEVVSIPVCSAPASPSDFERPFKLVCKKETFVVDSESLRSLSPVFAAMCFGKDFEGGRELSREIVDEKSDDVAAFLEALHNPETITLKNFPTVLRLANKYLVSKVIHACEDFVLDPLKDFKKQKPDEVLTLLIASADHHLARPVVEKLVLRLASEDKAMFNRLKLSRMLPAQIYGAVIGTSLNLSQIREQETMNGHVYRTERNRTSMEHLSMRRLPHLGELLFTSWALISSRVSAANPHVNQCLLRCKDNHMVEVSLLLSLHLLQMENEWSMSFALPLLSLLQSTGDEGAAYAKARLICQSNEQLEVCLRGCNDSTEQKILLIGLAPWKSTCSNLDGLRRQFPCWKDHSGHLSSGCGQETAGVRDSFSQFAVNGSLPAVASVCNEFDRFAACMVNEYAKYCGSAAEESTARMFSASKHAIKQMLQLKWSTLPKTCSKDFVRRDTSGEFFAPLSVASPTSLSLILLLVLLR